MVYKVIVVFNAASPIPITFDEFSVSSNEDEIVLATTVNHGCDGGSTAQLTFTWDPWENRTETLAVEVPGA